MNNEGVKKYVPLEELLDYGEWARVNGERHRGNLQKNRIELYKQFKKEQDEKRRFMATNSIRDNGLVLPD